MAEFGFINFDFPIIVPGLKTSEVGLQVMRSNLEVIIHRKDYFIVSEFCYNCIWMILIIYIWLIGCKYVEKERSINNPLRYPCFYYRYG